MGWLGIEESKTNPDATGWSTLKRAVVCGLGFGLSTSISMLLNGRFEWPWLLFFIPIGALVGAVWEWQNGDELFDSFDDDEDELPEDG